MLALKAGYQWSNNAVIEYNPTANCSTDSFFWGDSYCFGEAKLLVGYAVQLSESVWLVPMVGVSRWEFEAEEGVFLNPGEEAVKEFDGTDETFKVDLDFRGSGNFSFNVNYSHTSFDYGVTNNIGVGFKYRF